MRLTGLATAPPWASSPSLSSSPQTLSSDGMLILMPSRPGPRFAPAGWAAPVEPLRFPDALLSKDDVAHGFKLLPDPFDALDPLSHPCPPLAASAAVSLSSA